MLTTTVALYSCITCLTNRMGSILHHIMPLVINSLGGGHTHTHTHKHTNTHTKTHTDVRTETIIRNQARAGLRTWFK